MRWLLIFYAFFLPFFGFSQKKITVEHLRELPIVSDPQLSPDGKYLLYLITTSDVEKNKTNTVLMLLDVAENQKFELIKDVADPKWSPDGTKISFRANYGGITGVYAGDFALKKKKPTLDIPVLLAEIHSSNHFLGHSTVKNYAWSPDGQYLAFVSADTSTCNFRKDPNDPLEIERTLYKTRTAFSDNCLTKIYLASKSGKLLKCLTPDSFDCHSLAWSPDSKKLAFVSNHTNEPDHNYNNDLWEVNIESGVVLPLTQTVGTEHQPVWSPKGDVIAFPATVRPVNTKDSPPENTSIYGINPETKTRTNFTHLLDRRASNPQWHPDGEWLYFSANDQGKRGIFRVQSGRNPEPVILENGWTGDFQVSKDKIVYAYSTPDKPTEIYMADLDGKNPKQLTLESFSWRAGHSFSKVEDFWFSSFDGTMVQGFVAYPENKGNAKLPVVHRIHGGPHGMFGYSFSDINELLVSEGYAVVFINPRGSTGYGQKFADGTYQAWGGGDYKDLMLGMDAALEKFPFLDPDRLGVTGGSYGGFMTNWVITQTDRYKAAVTVASVSNLISFYGTSLYQLLIETEFNGLPWKNYELLWHFSPLSHIDQVKTPTLILHGENDNDVPITQAEEFYIALRKLEVPTRFVRYPNEGHGVRQPKHRDHYHQEIINWFNKYLKN